MNRNGRTSGTTSPREITIGLGHIVAAVIIAAFLIYLVASHAQADSLAGMNCPAPDHAVMTPTGPGCGQSVTFQVGAKR